MAAPRSPKIDLTKKIALTRRDREAVKNSQREVRVDLRPLQEFLVRLRGELGLEDADVTVCLITDAEIARMNHTYLKRKGPTDVISFPGIYLRRPLRFKRGAKAFKFKDPLGDIAISPKTARRYAEEYGQTLPDELRALILHGVLHLMGYNHETDNGEMDRKERKLLRRFGLI